jgi:tetratricopeptide (TPR) repeat protein
MNSKRIAAARSRVYIIVATIAVLLGTVSATGLMPEYPAEEAKRHIGENATVVGTIDCIGHGRRHVDLQIGGCLPNTLLWIVLPNDATGPEVDPEALRGVTVAVTGKLESSGGTPQLTVKSTTQIQPRSAVQTNYIGRAYDKETKGDLDGAIEDLKQAIEHQPARRDEACEHLARAKEKRGDWPGALATYDRLVELDPNKSGSYYVRATAKKQHGDFEGAMTDFTRAAELRSSGINLVEIGNMRKANGDSTGAMAEYDKAIAMLDSQIAGVQKPSDRLDLLYYHRGYAKELKGDVDGAVADYSQAIATKPSYEACAYSRRGDIKKARGDLAGAIADYQYAVKYAQLNEDKEKLNKAKAEVEREQAPLADSKSVYADDRATANLNRSAQTADDAESPTALVTRAKLRIRNGEFDGAIEDCDRALRLSRGGSKEAYDLRIQAMKAKGTSKSAVAQRVNPGSSQEEQPIAPSTESGPAVAAGQARPKATSALLVDPISGQPIGRETYNGSVKVEYSDGRSEIFCKDGNCTHPHVSHEGHVGWTHYTHREGRYNAAMNERLVIRFSNGQTKEFKPNPNGGPFIEEWNFIDNDVAVAIKSRGYHGPASFVRYDLISGRMTGHQDGYVEYEKMPKWAQPFSDDIPFPAASKADASEQTLSKQKALKSVNGNVKTQITFVNRSKQGVKVYWLDYSGERVLYRKLKDSESYTQDTYMTHPWLITDLRDNVWQIYMPTLQPRTVIVTAPKKP